MKNPKPQPALTAPSKRAPGRPRKPTTTTALENINPDPGEVQSACNFKDQLTAKEMKFLEIYLLGELNVDEAMISAGYVGYHPKSLYRLGRKIVEKFENQGGDHRKIARAIGAGEVTILRGLLELAKGARSEQVRCRAWQALASCVGLKADIPESHQQVSVIIYNKEEAQKLDLDGGAAPGSPQSQPLKTSPDHQMAPLGGNRGAIGRGAGAGGADSQPALPPNPIQITR